MIRWQKMLLMVPWFLLALNAPCWSVEVGGKMPDFAIRSLDGRRFSPASLEGKPVLLVFWNTWCAICQRELPDINRVAGKYRARGLEVLAINSGVNDSEDRARAYWKKYGYQFPTAFDGEFEVGEAFGLWGVPTLYLIDAKGVVRYKDSRLPADMEKRFQQLTFP